LVVGPAAVLAAAPPVPARAAVAGCQPRAPVDGAGWGGGGGGA